MELNLNWFAKRFSKAQYQQSIFSPVVFKMCFIFLKNDGLLILKFVFIEGRWTFDNTHLKLIQDNMWLDENVSKKKEIKT